MSHGDQEEKQKFLGWVEFVFLQCLSQFCNIDRESPAGLYIDLPSGQIAMLFSKGFITLQRQPLYAHTRGALASNKTLSLYPCSILLEGEVQ